MATEQEIREQFFGKIIEGRDPKRVLDDIDTLYANYAAAVESAEKELEEESFKKERLSQIEDIGKRFDEAQKMSEEYSKEEIGKLGNMADMPDNLKEFYELKTANVNLYEQYRTYIRDTQDFDVEDYFGEKENNDKERERINAETAKKEEAVRAAENAAKAAAAQVNTTDERAKKAASTGSPSQEINELLSEYEEETAIIQKDAEVKARSILGMEAKDPHNDRVQRNNRAKKEYIKTLIDTYNKDKSDKDKLPKNFTALTKESNENPAAYKRHSAVIRDLIGGMDESVKLGVDSDGTLSKSSDKGINVEFSQENISDFFESYDYVRTANLKKGSILADKFEKTNQDPFAENGLVEAMFTSLYKDSAEAEEKIYGMDAGDHHDNVQQRKNRAMKQYIRSMMRDYSKDAESKLKINQKSDPNKTLGVEKINQDLKDRILPKDFEHLTDESRNNPDAYERHSAIIKGLIDKMEDSVELRVKDSGSLSKSKGAAEITFKKEEFKEFFDNYDKVQTVKIRTNDIKNVVTQAAEYVAAEKRDELELAKQEAKNRINDLNKKEKVLSDKIKEAKNNAASEKKDKENRELAVRKEQDGVFTVTNKKVKDMSEAEIKEAFLFKADKELLDDIKEKAKKTQEKADKNARKANVLKTVSGVTTTVIDATDNLVKGLQLAKMYGELRDVQNNIKDCEEKINTYKDTQNTNERLGVSSTENYKAAEMIGNDDLKRHFADIAAVGKADNDDIGKAREKQEKKLSEYNEQSKKILKRIAEYSIEMEEQLGQTQREDGTESKENIQVDNAGKNKENIQSEIVELISKSAEKDAEGNLVDRKIQNIEREKIEAIRETERKREERVNERIKVIEETGKKTGFLFTGTGRTLINGAFKAADLALDAYRKTMGNFSSVTIKDSAGNKQTVDYEIDEAETKNISDTFNESLETVKKAFTSEDGKEKEPDNLDNLAATMAVVSKQLNSYRDSIEKSNRSAQYLAGVSQKNAEFHKMLADSCEVMHEDYKGAANVAASMNTAIAKEIEAYPEYKRDEIQRNRSKMDMLSNLRKEVSDLASIMKAEKRALTVLENKDNFPEPLKLSENDLSADKSGLDMIKKLSGVDLPANADAAKITDALKNININSVSADQYFNINDTVKNAENKDEAARQKAEEIGCAIRDHYKALINGEKSPLGEGCTIASETETGFLKAVNIDGYKKPPVKPDVNLDEFSIPTKPGIFASSEKKKEYAAAVEARKNAEAEINKYNSELKDYKNSKDSKIYAANKNTDTFIKDLNNSRVEAAKAEYDSQKIQGMEEGEKKQNVRRITLDSAISKSRGETPREKLVPPVELKKAPEKKPLTASM